MRRQAAQGDCLITAVDHMPDGLTEIEAIDGRHVVAHSETGHDHFINSVDARLYRGADPMVCYLRVDGEHADLTHARSFDQHETIRITKGIWEIRRQREHTPEGWKMVED